MTEASSETARAFTEGKCSTTPTVEPLLAFHKFTLPAAALAIVWPSTEMINLVICHGKNMEQNTSQHMVSNWLPAKCWLMSCGDLSLVRQLPQLGSLCNLPKCNLLIRPTDD